MSSNNMKNKILEIQSRWLRLIKDPNYPLVSSTVRTVLDLITELMYIEPGQFVLEFLQNAEDALMEAGKKGYFKIELYKDKIVISNNGKPFDEKDLESLCSVASKKKPAAGYKGFIGIGWKSVYKVSNHVEICSAGTCFEFNEEYWKRPEAQEILNKYYLKPEEVLWQVTPIPIEPIEALPPDETRFIIYLKDPSLYNKINETINELGPSLLLFLDYVNKVMIDDYVSNRHKRIEWSIDDEDIFNGTKVKIVKVIISEDGKTSYYKFLTFRKEFQIPEDVKKDDETIKAKRDNIDKREVAIAFSLDPVKDELKPIEEARFWGIYSFLPLTEIRTGLKFLIQADFIVHPGRRYINVEAKWNHHMMKSLAKLLVDVISYLMKKFKKSYLSVFDYREILDEIWIKLTEPYIIKTINNILIDPIVPCYKGHDVKLSQVVKASEEIFELIKYGLLSEEDLTHIYGVEKHILDPMVRLRERDEKEKVSKLSLIDLLNENLIKAKMSKNLEKALNFLSHIYKLADKRYIMKIQVPNEKRFIITSSGDLKLAQNVYIPRTPQYIIDLSKKFSEIKGYLESLNFVHEKMIELVGEDILKQLGVREVSLREVAEEVILKQIIAKNPPPDKDKLLIATFLVKQAGLVINEPIWVLTKDGDIESSDNVWNPKLFEGFEDVANLLNIKLLDIKSYLKYDENAESWKRFFEKIVKGFILHECAYYGYSYQCYLSKDVNELVNEIKKALEDAGVDNNVKLIRFLKNLYKLTLSIQQQLNFPIQWNKIIVRLITDEEGFAYSNQLLLHDVYKAAEEWFKWKDKGFPIGPFVSPRYLDEPNDASLWRRFFVEILDVKNAVDNEVIEKFAEWHVEKILSERGYKIINKGGESDFQINVDKDIIYVEVKGRRKRIDEIIDVELTERETRLARSLREKYWLIVVENIPNDPKAWVLKDPTKVVSKIKIDGEYIKKYGEALG